MTCASLGKSVDKTDSSFSGPFMSHLRGLPVGLSVLSIGKRS
ncbi:hypothetical protein LEP1GSC061_1047 [Leptospira wolffii serovar Khorat str. Khorat-H2]|nr:hypothetical protein LEP1GSC061_1047 [Leptospira wolffii serovar Khorat str. Khorat-H2]